MNGQIQLDQDILHSEYHGCELNLTIQDSGRTLSALNFLRTISEIETIQVRDDDGWECEEVDLLSEKALAELSGKLTPTPPLHADSISPDAVPYLILASQSPRRQELLSLAGIPFEAKAADIDEDAVTGALKDQFSKEPFSIMAAMIVMNLARAKAGKLLDTNPDAVVIGSDTIVTIDDSILGKPSSPDDAFEMLRRLSGREHHVFTGVSIISRSKEETFFTVTRVGFFPWTTSEIDLARRYISEGSPLDKAGAYGIQDMGALFIRGIKGDYYTVMGLPVSEVYHRLKDFRIS
ncbi:MAG: Maf family protein [Eubacteriales bacterium]